MGTFAVFSDCAGFTNPGITVHTDMTRRAAVRLIKQVGRIYPEAVEAAARALEIIPSVHACDGCREGVAVGLVDLEAVATCGACAPSLHDHDCSVCDGEREVQDGN